MVKGKGGIGSHKHGTSGHAPRSPRYKFQQTLEANRRPVKQRPALSAKTVQEAMAQIKKVKP